jgi:hypothetical protein
MKASRSKGQQLRVPGPDLNSSGTATSVSGYWRNFSAAHWPMGSTPRVRMEWLRAELSF